MTALVRFVVKRILRSVVSENVYRFTQSSIVVRFGQPLCSCTCFKRGGEISFLSFFICVMLCIAVATPITFSALGNNV